MTLENRKAKRTEIIERKKKGRVWDWIGKKGSEITTHETKERN